MNQKCSYFNMLQTKAKIAGAVHSQTHYFLWKDKSLETAASRMSTKRFCWGFWSCSRRHVVGSWPFLSWHPNYCYISFVTLVCSHEKNSTQKCVHFNSWTTLWHSLRKATCIIFISMQGITSSQILSALPREITTFLAFSLPVNISRYVEAKLHIPKFLVLRKTNVDIHVSLPMLSHEYTHG